jgi:S-DNA-T family DNA segregation ATPase FtsK/SpoIIIE
MIGRRVLRPEAQPPSIRFRAPNVHVPLWLLAGGWLVIALWLLLRWLAGHRRCAAVLAVAGWVLWMDAVLPAVAVALTVAGLLCGWWVLEPASFARWVTRPVQLELREWLTYRREWQPAMLTAGLSLRESWGGDLPTLRRVSSDAGRDVLRVKMLPGQTLEKWTGATAALAQTFGARAVRVRRVLNRPQELDLLVTLRGGAQNHHVTERRVDVDTEQVPEPRGAFPRAPRRGAA